MPAASSKASSPPICRWSSPPDSSSSSICRPPRCSASTCRPRCSPAPTKSSNRIFLLHRTSPVLALSGLAEMVCKLSALRGEADMRDRATSTHRSRLTHSGHKPERNPAAQQDPDSICPNPLCCCLAGQRMQFDRLRRREFVTLLGGAATWPLVARAQQSSTPVIGFLGGGSPDLMADRLRAFPQGLSETGYVEGNNVAIEYRWAEGQYDRLPALAADLVRSRITVMATPDTPATLAAKAVTTTIPIVFYTAADPVEVGFVANLARPGGNLTGVTILGVELGSKRL